MLKTYSKALTGLSLAIQNVPLNVAIVIPKQLQDKINYKIGIYY